MRYGLNNWCFRMRGLLISLSAFVCLPLSVSSSHGLTLEYDEYHCYYGWEGVAENSVKSCEGNGSSYSLSKYIINPITKSVAIIESQQGLTIVDKKKHYYYWQSNSEIWTECDIVDAKNFACNRAVGKNGGYEIFQLADGKAVRCSYCVRYKQIGYWEYLIATTYRSVIYEFCATKGYEGRKCPF